MPVNMGGPSPLFPALAAGNPIAIPIQQPMGAPPSFPPPGMMPPPPPGHQMILHQVNIFTLKPVYSM